MKQPPVAGLGRRKKRPSLFQRAKALRATPAALELFRGFGSGHFATARSEFVDGAYLEAKSATYAHMYRSQENIRIVVDAIARVATDHTLKCYKRELDGQRTEDGDHPAAASLREPNDWQATRELIEVLAKDKLIYDDAYLWDMGADENDRRFLIRVPPPAMQVGSNNALRPTHYRVTFQDGTWLDLDPSEVIHWRGYSAGDNRMGVPAMETLRTILVESSVRKAQSVDQIRGGMIKGGIITRPPEAPPWSEEAMERFSESFASRLRGVIHGETPILEEGMQFQEAGITPKEAEMLANRRFELDLVANTFGVNPAYFSTSGNLDAARRQMKEDVVQPLLGRLAETFTHQLVRGIYNDRQHFFRFRERKETDLGKLFEAGSKSTGGSVLTTNEFREDYLDKPPVEGGDEIVKHPGSQGGGTPPAPDSDPRGRPATDPSIDEEEKAIRAKADELRELPILGVDEGQEARIQDAIADLTRPLPRGMVTRRQRLLRREAASERQDIHFAEHAELFRNHFRRQQAAKAAGKEERLDSARWNRELTSDLRALAFRTVEQEAGYVAGNLNSEFDPVYVTNYLNRGAELAAREINKAVQVAFEERGIEALDEAVEKYAEYYAHTRAQALTNFAAQEAAKQSAASPTRGKASAFTAQKQWVGSGSTNTRHGGVADEVVGVYEYFSNGAAYPGDSVLGTDETTNCKCDLDVWVGDEGKLDKQQVRDKVVDDGLSVEGREIAEDAFQSIEKVHDLPSEVPKLRLVENKGIGSREANVTGYEPAGTRVNLNTAGKTADRADSAAMVHEYGHYLDDTIFPEIRGFETARSDSAFRPVLQKIEASPEGKLWAEEASRSFSGAAETWARAYEQWIATRAGNAAMKASMQNAPKHRGMSGYWTEENFKPIGEELDRLFARLGLRKPQ